MRFTNDASRETSKTLETVRNVRTSVKDRRVSRKQKKVRRTFFPANGCQGRQTGNSYRDV